MNEADYGVNAFDGAAVPPYRRDARTGVLPRRVRTQWLKGASIPAETQEVHIKQVSYTARNTRAVFCVCRYTFFAPHQGFRFSDAVIAGCRLRKAGGIPVQVRAVTNARRQTNAGLPPCNLYHIQYET